MNQFTHSVVSDSLRPHGLQHTRPSCPSSSLGACSNSCPLNRWCHPTISSSVIPFSSCPQSFPASGSFPMSQFFSSGGQSIGASASATVLPMNIQDWFPLGWTGLIFLQSKGLSRVFSSAIVWKHQFFSAQPSLWSNSHPYVTTRKVIVLTIWILVGKMMSLLSNTLSRFVIAFLLRSKCLLISWLQSFWSTRKENLSLVHFFHSTCHEVIGLDTMILVSWMLSFKPASSLFYFTFIERF